MTILRYIMKLYESLQVVPICILRSTIYFYRAQFIAYVADGIYGARCVCVCVVYLGCGNPKAETH